MHKDRIAEWILELVTTPDRATSTVGDLMETGGDHGSVWFWSRVLQTAGAMLWQSFTGEPWKVLKIGFLGSLGTYVLASLAELAGMGGVVAAWAWIRGIFRPLEQPELEPLLHGWIFYFATFSPTVLVMFLAGRWAARKAPGNELNASLMLIALLVAISIPINTAILRATGGYPSADMMRLQFVTNIAGLIAIFFGGVSVRTKSAHA